MRVIGGLVGPVRTYSRRQWLWRGLLAAPFAVCLLLALVLGPARIDSRYGSFGWLVVGSLAGGLLMLRLRAALLIPVGVIGFVLFPPLAALGFYFAPGWALPAAAVGFYGSMASCLAAVLLGVAHLLSRRRRARRAAAVGAGVVLVVAVVAMGTGFGGSRRLAPLRAAATVPVNLGPVINTARREAEPSFTADGATMYFNCDDYDICVTNRTGTGTESWEQARWSTPQRLGAPISTGYVEVEPWINAAGDRLYFNSIRPFGTGSGLPGLSVYVTAAWALGQVTDLVGVSLFGGLGHDDVWVSDRVGGVWSTPRNLADVPGEPPVNTAFNDHCLDFSADGNEAFWTSTRPGGYGGNDLWTSRRVDGRWTPARNLGPNVNGPGSEHHSMPGPDGRTLYVTSDRPGGYGGEDIYITTRAADGAWGPLVNAGPVVNGPGNDRCVTFTPDGTAVLFDSDRPGGYGSKDLWWVPTSDLR
jgi:hypothetical protein